MVTINNNPGTGEVREGSATGLIVGTLLVLLVVALLIIFGLPLLRSAPPEQAPENAGASINVDVKPGGGSSGGESKPAY